MLCCPKCKERLTKSDHVYTCSNHHSYDIAKRGYVNLLLGNHKSVGDDKAMIVARTKFLNHRYYQRLCEHLTQMIKNLNPVVLIDAGCGEGYYTNQFKEVLPKSTIIGFDLSKSGVDHACTSHTGVLYSVASVFQLPLDNACSDAVVSVFAPIDEKENARILKEKGYFLKVGPAAKHLWELKEFLYQDVYENVEDKSTYELFTLVKEETLTYTITLDNQEDIWALFQMTPYYWKTSKEAVEKLMALSTLTTLVSFHIELYQKKEANLQ